MLRPSSPKTVNMLRLIVPCDLHGEHIAYLSSMERDIAVAFALIVRDWHHDGGYRCFLECLTDDEPLVVSPFSPDEDMYGPPH